MARTGLNHINQIAPAPSPAAWESEPFAIPGTLQECIDQLKEAKRDVKQIFKEIFAQRDSERRKNSGFGRIIVTDRQEECHDTSTVAESGR